MKLKRIFHKFGIFGYEKVIPIFCKECGYQGEIGISHWVYGEMNPRTRCKKCGKIRKLHNLFKRGKK